MAASKEILQEVEKTLGVVPTFLKGLEHDAFALEHSWELIKKYILGESLIPAKYRELMGVAVASAVHCRFCVTFHSGVAKLFGATDEEIREAAFLAKHTVGWSAFVDGTLADIGQLETEMAKIAEHMSSPVA
ncbi:MAG: carboxymuconolactone decarboxylase family protein [Candidatus Eisenbacteria sp.]|nr:carboxymuconolactone decarboxylase family protein [Candidatus Eisenbacteria bacterium]